MKITEERLLKINKLRSEKIEEAYTRAIVRDIFEKRIDDALSCGVSFEEIPKETIARIILEELSRLYRTIENMGDA